MRIACAIYPQVWVAVNKEYRFSSLVFKEGVKRNSHCRTLYGKFYIKLQYVTTGEAGKICHSGPAMLVFDITLRPHKSLRGVPLW